MLTLMLAATLACASVDSDPRIFDANQAMKSADLMEAEARKHLAASNVHNPGARVYPGEVDTANEYIDQMEHERTTAVELFLKVADDRLKNGCIDAADAVYRRVLSEFSGGNWEAYRQRAMVGIEDVRSARKAHP